MDTSESFVTAISDTNMGSNENEVPGESGPPVNETVDVPGISPNLAGTGSEETQPEQIDVDTVSTSFEVRQEDVETPIIPDQPEVETTPVSQAGGPTLKAVAQMRVAAHSSLGNGSNWAKRKRQPVPNM